MLLRKLGTRNSPWTLPSPLGHPPSGLPSPSSRNHAWGPYGAASAQDALHPLNLWEVWVLSDILVQTLDKEIISTELQASQVRCNFF